MIGALLLAVSLGAPGCAPLPDAFIREVEETARQLLVVGRSLSPPLRVQGVHIERLPAFAAVPDGTLRLVLLRGARCGDRVAPSVCEADTRDPSAPVIACRASALMGVTGDHSGGETAPSPALLFVLAHEMAHVAAGVPGRFGGDGIVISGRSPLAVKREDLACVCPERAAACGVRRDSRSLEEAADGWGGAALDEALQSERFGAAVLGSRGARYQAQGMIEAAAERAFGAPGVRGLWTWEEFKEVTPAHVAAALLRARCRVLRPSQGNYFVPSFGTSHPSMPERLLKLAARLDAERDREAPAGPESPAGGSNLQELLAVASRAGLGAGVLPGFRSPILQGRAPPPPLGSGMQGRRATAHKVSAFDRFIAAARAKAPVSKNGLVRSP